MYFHDISKNVRAFIPRLKPWVFPLVHYKNKIPLFSRSADDMVS